MAVSVAGALAALLYAYGRYVKKSHVPAEDRFERGTLARLSYNKYYIDFVLHLQKGWRALQKRGMARKSGWAEAARQYVELYQKL